MKVQGLVGAVLVAGIAGSMALFSCGKKSSDSGDDDKQEAEVTDATQPLTLAIETATVDVPAGALPAGTKISLKTADKPAEFVVDGVSDASRAIELAATGSEGALAKAVLPMTIALDLNDAAALDNVDPVVANICVLAKGQDGALRRWINSILTIDENGKTIKFPTVWFGHFIALYCGDHFTDVAQVLPDGSDVIATGTDTSQNTGSQTKTDPSTSTASDTCNTLANDATEVQLSDGGTGLPSATGGSLVDGTYHLVEATYYKVGEVESVFKNMTPPFIQETGVLAGNTFQLVDKAFGKDEIHETWTFAVSGSDPGLTRTCTTADEENSQIPWTKFMTDGTYLHLLSETSPYQIELIYKRQD